MQSSSEGRVVGNNTRLISMTVVKRKGASVRIPLDIQSFGSNDIYPGDDVQVVYSASAACTIETWDSYSPPPTVEEDFEPDPAKVVPAPYPTYLITQNIQVAVNVSPLPTTIPVNTMITFSGTSALPTPGPSGTPYPCPNTNPQINNAGYTFTVNATPSASPFPAPSGADENSVENDFESGELTTAGIYSPEPQSFRRSSLSASGCKVKYLDAPLNGNLSDPSSPMAITGYQICFGGLAVASMLDVLTAYPIYPTPSGPSPANAYGSVTVTLGACTLPSNDTRFTCMTAPSTVPPIVAFGAFIGSVTKTTFSDKTVSPVTTVPYLLVNKKNVIYPVLNIFGYGGTLNSNVPLPGFSSLADVRACPSKNTPSGCPARTSSFRTDLATYYLAQSSSTPPWTLPSGYYASPTTVDAHHIWPISWGGPSLNWNGIFINNSYAKNTGGSNDHQVYTTWWCGFAVPPPGAAPPCSDLSND